MASEQVCKHCEREITLFRQGYITTERPYTQFCDDDDIRFHEPAEPPTPAAEPPRLMISKGGEIHEYCSDCRGECSQYGGPSPAQEPQPLPSNFPRCSDCGTRVCEHVFATIADLRRQLEQAISSLRVLNEETVLAGYPGGDRDQTLANVRQMRAALPAPPSAPETSKEK